MTNEAPTADEAPDAAATTTDLATVSSAELAAGAASPQPWHARNNHGQTNSDRYFMPFLTPLLSVGGILFFVLNLSRVFISGTKTITIVSAAVVTIGILIAASALANAPKMRSQSLAVFGAVGLVVIMFGGLISVGHAAEKKEKTEVACTPALVSLSIVGTGSNQWANPAYDAKAGCVQIVMSGAAHTFEFTSPNAPKFPLLKGVSAESQRTFAADFVAGEYEFHCTIPGHETMKAKLVVK